MTVLRGAANMALPTIPLRWRDTIVARVPYISRSDLPEDKRHIFDHIAETRGSVDHVFQALLNSPDVAEAVGGLGEYMRYKSPLDPKVREIAILSTARELQSDYEWAQHVPVARKAGVSEQVLDSIKSGRAPMGIPAKEGVFAQAAKELVREGTLTDRTFQAVLHLLGLQQTVDLIVLVGYYTMVARTLAALEVELDEHLQAE